MLTKNIYDLTLHPENIHGGVGSCMHTTVFDGHELATPVRFVNYTVLPPHTSFGAHEHGNDNEIYVVLSGEGIYTENNSSIPVKKGSVMVNGTFSSHSLKNTGNENLEMLVLEVYNAD